MNRNKRIEQIKNFKILLNFAAISDDISKKNSYQNLLNFIDSEFYLENGFLSFKDNNYDEERLVKAENMAYTFSDLSSQSINTVLSTITPYNQEDTEFLKLIKNYNTDHDIIKKIKFFVKIKEKLENNFDYNNYIDSFHGFLTPDFSPKRSDLSVLVEGDFPLIEYPSNDNEINQLKIFFDKYPSLKTFDNFDEALNKSINNMHNVYESFFDKIRIIGNLNEEEYNELSTQCIDLQKMSEMVQKSISCEPARGTLDHDESQPTVYFNVASLKISDIIKYSLDLEKKLKNNNSNKRKMKP